MTCGSTVISNEEHQVTLHYCNTETPTATATYRPFVPCLASWATHCGWRFAPLELKWQGRKYFLKQRVHCLVQGILCIFAHEFKNEIKTLRLFNSHKLVSRPWPIQRTFKTNQDQDRDSRHPDRDQDQDFQNSVSRRLETKTQVSRTPSCAGGWKLPNCGYRWRWPANDEWPLWACRRGPACLAHATRFGAKKPPRYKAGRVSKY